MEVELPTPVKCVLDTVQCLFHFRREKLRKERGGGAGRGRASRGGEQKSWGGQWGSEWGGKGGEWGSEWGEGWRGAERGENGGSKWSCQSP